MFTLFAGPCQIESLEHACFMSSKIMSITERLGIPFVYKSSFDKANRTSIHGERGPGLSAGMSILSEVKKIGGVKIMTDVHEVWQVDPVAAVADVIQIPAMLSRQTDLLRAAASTRKIINIKKGQGMSAEAAVAAGAKVLQAWTDDDYYEGMIYLCERGTTFGYGDLVVDFRSIARMKKDFPVMFDATHSVQRPSALGHASGGQREFIAPLCRAAVAVGIDALFIEVHQDPDTAPSDGPCMLPLDKLEPLLRELVALHNHRA